MIDAFSPYFSFIGILTSAVGSVIVLTLLIMWAADLIINLLGLKEAIMAAYRQHLISKKEASKL